jgi:ubiquinone/menaquinone biosynthesis C-methylase UbiE
MEHQKKRQVEYHEGEHYRPLRPRITDNSNPLISWLNNHRINKLLELTGPLTGKTVLSVCGGDGEEGDFLQRKGAEVTVTDLSGIAIEAARVRNPSLRCLRMDTESLAFPDRSFDWVVVRDGLHHLARPIKGLYELERVSKEGFAILEGQDTAAVRLLVKLRAGEDWDPAGGYTYRFSRREILKIFSSMQTLSRWRIVSNWLLPGSDVLKYFPAVKRFIFPVINHTAFLRIATSTAGRSTLKGLFRGINLLAGRWGNSLIVVAWKLPGNDR